MPVDEATVKDLAASVLSFQRAMKCLGNVAVGPGEPGLGPLGVLGFVYRNEPTRAADVARWLGVGAAVLSRHVAELESHGYLVRQPDPADARALLLHLTPQGRDVVDEAYRHRAEVLRGLLAGWDEGEARTAIDTLGRLEDALRHGLGREAARGAAADAPQGMEDK